MNARAEPEQNPKKPNNNMVDA
jgi:hypothetical protein